MIKTMAKAAILFLTIMSGVPAGPVYAEQGNSNNVPGGGQAAYTDDEGYGGRHERFNLTDDQRKQLKDIFKKHRQAMKAAFKQIRDNREALDKELGAATPDMNKITDLQNQLKALQGQMVDSRLNSLLEVKKILTPEQFGQYLKFRKHRSHGRWQHHRHCGFGRHCRHHHEDWGNY